MYAIVKTGGKQYRIEQGESLLVERLPVEEGADVTLEPLLYVDDSRLLDGQAAAKVKVQARVVAHERGPKLRVVKFKPKRGYKRRTGHRQELTRLEVKSIKAPAARSRSSSSRSEPAARRSRASSSRSEGSAGRSRASSSRSASPARSRTKKEDAQDGS